MENTMTTQTVRHSSHRDLAALYTNESGKCSMADIIISSLYCERQFSINMNVRPRVESLVRNLKASGLSWLSVYDNAMKIMSSLLTATGTMQVLGE